VLYPLSYGPFGPAGFEPATTALKAKYQISSPPDGKSVAGEQARTEWRTTAAQGTSPFEDLPGPASRHPSRGRLHGTQIDLRRNRKSGAVSERSNRTLHHRQTASRGTSGTALVFSEEIRAFTTWNSVCRVSCKISFVSGFGSSVGPETKTPPELWLGRGSITRTVDGISPFRLREKTRVRCRPGIPARRSSTST
jgi:hypothetical protein